MTSRVSDHEITIGLQRVVVGLVLLVLALVLGVLVASDVDPLDVDIWWNTVVGTLAPALQPLSLFMNVAGGGWIATFAIPVAGALLLVAGRRPWGALFFIAASAVSAVIVQVFKHLFGRARPEDILVISDYGSFPSGHTANAATIAIVAVLLFPRLWVGLAGIAWVLLMAFSRTQVHAHWLSDTVGGTLVGAGVALLVAAAFTVPLYREQERRQRAALAHVGRAPRP